MKCRTPPPSASDTEIVQPRVGAAQWQAELQRLQALGPAADKVPERFASAQEWGRRWGMTRDHASKLINTGMRVGAWEMKKFSIRAGQRLYPVPHYAEKIGKKTGKP